MDEELKNRVAESMDGILSYVQEGAAFAVDQAPLVAQEMVAWGIAQGLMLFVLGMLTLIPYALILRHQYKKVDTPDKRYPSLGRTHDGTDFAMASFVGGAIVIIPVLVAIQGLFDATKAIVSPRLFIVERIAELVN